jgi:uncharacterized protein
MEERIVKFISSLRAAGVRISLAESADAFNAIDNLGIKNRNMFRLSLRSTLVKDSSNLQVFEELFPLFFGNNKQPPMMNISDDLTPEEARMLAEALREFNDNLRQMLDKMLKGKKLNQQELDRLARLVGLNQADNLRYREWMVQRMMKALHFSDVQEALKELSDLLAQMGMDRERVDQMGQLMQANQQALEDQLRQFAGETIAKNMSDMTPEENANKLMDRPFNTLSDSDMDQLRKEVQRLAAILRTRIALRQKRAKNGQLDAKSTIRSNLKNNSVPIEIKHREHTLKPKLVVLCDVSTSMRFCSELMLSLLHGMQDQISKTNSFAFIDHLEFISPDFEERDIHKAVHKVLERMPSGYYNTDFGNSLQDFDRKFREKVDSRTTFIIVGDGRNNYNDPRLDLFTTLAHRSRRTIWLNPEPSTLWGNGDSDMMKYAPKCNVILQASTLTELTAAVDKLLSV